MQTLCVVPEELSWTERVAEAPSPPGSVAAGFLHPRTQGGDFRAWLPSLGLLFGRRSLRSSRSHCSWPSARVLSAGATQCPHACHGAMGLFVLIKNHPAVSTCLSFGHRGCSGVVCCVTGTCCWLLSGTIPCRLFHGEPGGSSVWS